MSRESRVFEPGQLVLVTGGDYAQYTVYHLMRVLRPFSTDDKSLSCWVDDLALRGLVEEVPFAEWQFSDDGDSWCTDYPSAAAKVAPTAR